MSCCRFCSRRNHHTSDEHFQLFGDGRGKKIDEVSSFADQVSKMTLSSDFPPKMGKNLLSWLAGNDMIVIVESRK